MCILIHHKTDTQFDLAHLQDFYSHNSDGFGAMVKKPDGVKIIKTVGNLDEINELYNNEIKGHEAVIHFRMKTHGDIDLFNCHPYQITEDLWMAHNGILSMGNAADVTKSDTWHYIQNYLRPLLMKDQSLIHEPAFQKLIESHIGSSNKFGFMDSNGKVVIINQSAGVDYFGAWLSNTYAWTPSKWGYYAATHGNRYYSSYGKYDYGQYNYGADYWDRETNVWKKEPEQKTLPFKKEKKSKGKKSDDKSVLDKGTGRLSTKGLRRVIRSCYNAIQRHPDYGLVDWVVCNPMHAMHLINEFYPNWFKSQQEISDLVNASPDEAAAVIESLWYECEEDLLALAQIPHVINEGEIRYATDNV